jgi:hypothetical protein
VSAAAAVNRALDLHTLVAANERKHGAVEVGRVIQMNTMGRPENRDPFRASETRLEPVQHQREDPRADVASHQERGDSEFPGVIAGERLGR